MTHDDLPEEGPLFPTIRASLVDAATPSTPTRALRRSLRPSRLGAAALSIIAIGAGAGGFAVAGSLNGDTQTPPPAEAPAPNPARPDARQDLNSALAFGGLDDTSAFPIPPEKVDAMRAGFAPGIAAEKIPDDRVLFADKDLQIVSFTGPKTICLRVRPVGGGGNALCATPPTANDPATPMYTAPEPGESGPLVLLAPDTITKVVVRYGNGRAAAVPIRRNVAIVKNVSDFTSLTWVTTEGKAYRRP